VLRGPLISAEEVRGLEATLLDVRWSLSGPPGREEYDAGHIPGAVFVDLDLALAGPPGEGGRHPMPQAATFERAMREAGVRDDLVVVAYDGGNSIAAARAWWLLRYFGHPRVAVLDGGLPAWIAAGGELSTEVPTAVPGDFLARPGGMALLDADAAGALARAGVLLDNRAPERFRGETEPIDPVAGHIPGARNRPGELNLDSGGRFAGPDSLREAFAALGIDDATEVGAYCGSGVAAAQQVLALERAGHPGAALYLGSWSDWITDPTRPVATG
jgi:thiosulfate/3-mercaptopyruvate sulfurtransferase